MKENKINTTGVLAKPEKTFKYVAISCLGICNSVLGLIFQKSMKEAPDRAEGLSTVLTWLCESHQPNGMLLNVIPSTNTHLGADSESEVKEFQSIGLLG